MVSWSALITEKRNLKWIKKIGLYSIIFLGGWFTYKQLTNFLNPKIRSFCEKFLTEDGADRFEDRVVSVEVETLKPGAMSRRINTIGRLRANAIVEIKSETTARVRDVPVQDGDTITEGSTIIQFDDSEMQARLKIAKAEHAYRKAEFERSSKLQVRNFESLKKLEETKAECDKAAGKIDECQSNLDKMSIKAPFNGVVGLINVNKGSYIQPGHDLGSFVDNSVMRIDFKIPENHIHEIGVGQTVEVKLQAFKDQIFQGTVDAVEPKSDPESHSVKVRAGMENPNSQFRHNMFCTVSLIIGEKGNTLAVEESAVEREGEIEYIWIVEKGKAMKKRVLTGTRENGRVEIVAGASEGDVIIIAGQLKLYPGIRVKVSNLPDTLKPALSPDLKTQKKSETDEVSQTDKTTESLEAKPDSTPLKAPDESKEDTKEDTKEDKTENSPELVAPVSGTQTVS